MGLKEKTIQFLSSSGGHFIKRFVSDFHWQILQATEILASDWLRANLSMKNTDKTLDEMPPRNHQRINPLKTSPEYTRAGVYGKCVL